MKKRSIIDDVEVEPNSKYGIPIMFQNPLIRKMFNLVDLKSNDIFYDLGSGWGQNILIALTEFNVKEAVGIEKNEERVIKSKKRLEKQNPEKSGRIIQGKFEKLFDNKLPGADISKATVIFYGLSSDKELFHNLEKTMNDKCRLVYYYNCLFPEIMPIKVDFPFFVSKKPFVYTRSELEWLKSVTQKRKSSILQNLTTQELWDELSHDYDIEGDVSDIKSYKNRLKKTLEKKDDKK